MISDMPIVCEKCSVASAVTLASPVSTFRDVQIHGLRILVECHGARDVIVVTDAAALARRRVTAFARYRGPDD